MRALGRSSASGGKNKKERVKTAAKICLDTTKALRDKLAKIYHTVRIARKKDILLIIELEEYMKLMDKHIDLVERRLIKGEVIPHEEKMFSIFETYTEWIQKGKRHPSVELGKKVAITTDQYHLVNDYRVLTRQADSQIVKEIYENLSPIVPISVWSFDKGFWSKENKSFLQGKVILLVLPKKGKCNKQETEEEHQPRFKKHRNLHSAVESNINELEHRGLNRCPDRGYEHFKRYVGIAVCAYNLKKIGKQLIEEQHASEKALRRKIA